MPSLFRQPLTQLKRIGNKKAELFSKLGVDSIGSLLRLYPRNYIDMSNPVKIDDADPQKPCCILASIEKKYKPVCIRNNLTILRLSATDGYSRMEVVLFNQQYLFDKLETGNEYLFYGVVSKGTNSFKITSPQINDPSLAIIRPIYHQIQGLTSKQIEDAVSQAIELLPDKINDPIPQYILEEYSLCNLNYAIKNIHFPPDMKALETARNRLVFEELLILQLGMSRLKTNRNRIHSDINRIQTDYSQEFYKLLPFKPTKAQERTLHECINDMIFQSYPMNRLIQGDVGSGKTIVAAGVCYSAVKNGLQCAFMAPTEILAEQHYNTLSKLFSDSGIKIEILTGSTSTTSKKIIKEKLLNGEINIIIGTHALLSDSVGFKKLGLVITDEQHRFGVAQRAALISKGDNPHIIVMSATPIPRTLALLIFGDLDLSVIDELPPDRQIIDTYLVFSNKRPDIYHFIKEQIINGRQIYIVCPLVDINENTYSGLMSAEEYIDKLQESELSEFRIGLLHGKMRPSDKELVMSQFSNGEIDILISTTVIEVGVDVPNAVIMLVENAERFGLSQLHQLRGRVGRGKHKSYCILVSDSKSDVTRERLTILCTTNDGFKIADEDLRLRGPGDFFGSRQSGLPELRIAGFSDIKLIESARQAASNILQHDPDLSSKEYRPLNFETRRLFGSVGGQRLQ